MLKSLRRILSVPKKAFLVKLLPVLGFGGMVGFCTLSCDKQVGAKDDIVKDTNGVEVGVLGEVKDPNEASGDVVLKPKIKPTPKTSDLDISDVYGPPRP